MFCVSLYKRHYEKKLIHLLKKQKSALEAKTFGNFTLTFEGKVIGFSRSKSEELMAYLIYGEKDGKTAVWYSPSLKNKIQN